MQLASLSACSINICAGAQNTYRSAGVAFYSKLNFDMFSWPQISAAINYETAARGLVQGTSRHEGFEDRNARMPHCCSSMRQLYKCLGH